MNFIAPGAFALGLLLPVIVAFYLLKLRRVERQVSSLYLWRRMVQDVEANAPWQRLRPNLLMILQLLFLAALILALTRPFTWSQGVTGDAAILILDSSASMAATDTTPNRLEAAKARARQLIIDLADTTRLTIIEAGRQAAVRLASSRDRRQARLAIDSIQPGTSGSDMGVALELASAIAARQPGSEIIVLSDGKVELPERLALKGRLRFLPVGTSSENQAVSLLNLETRPDGSLAAFVQTSNYGDSPARRRLSLYADGNLVNAFDLEIPAQGDQPLVVEDLPLGTRQVEVRLEPPDALALDDRALAVAPVSHLVRVTLVSNGNLFLETALKLLPGIELLQVAPEDATKDTLADLTIYDAVAAPEDLPSGNLLFIAPPRTSTLFTTSGVVQNPVLRAVDPGDPLLEHVSLAGVSVLDAARIPLPEWALPVVMGDLAGESTPLMLRGEVDGVRVVVLAFDLHHSDLALQPAFPLLWVNLVDWLVPGLGGPLPAQVAPGSSVSFDLSPSGGSQPAGEEVATVRRPDGSSVQVQPENGQVVFTDTNELGIYQVSWGKDQGAEFAVNLFSRQESDIRPADSLGGASSAPASNATTAAGQRGMREFWHPLALLALGLLVGEWLVYQRAGLARGRDWIAGRLGGLFQPTHH